MGLVVSSPFSFSCKRTPKDAEDQLEAALGASQALKAAGLVVPDVFVVSEDVEKGKPECVSRRRLPGRSR